jgi:hypothetical protein
VLALRTTTLDQDVERSGMTASTGGVEMLITADFVVSCRNSCTNRNNSLEKDRTATTEIQSLRCLFHPLVCLLDNEVVVHENGQLFGRGPTTPEDWKKVEQVENATVHDDQILRWNGILPQLQSTIWLILVLILEGTQLLTLRRRAVSGPNGVRHILRCAARLGPCTTYPVAPFSQKL